MRNFGLFAVLITQRIQDLNTYFRCRTSLGIGRISLDDWDLKIRRLLRLIEDKKKILTMPKGSFYFSAINDIITFPMFKPSNPKEFIPNIKQLQPQKPKRKTLTQKIKNLLSSFNLQNLLNQHGIATQPLENMDSEETDELDGIIEPLEGDLDC